MGYKTQYESVVSAFEYGMMSEEKAINMIGEIEERAYNTIPDAEPDGDITFQASMALDTIRTSRK